jgi:hypothetical protein
MQPQPEEEPGSNWAFLLLLAGCFVLVAAVAIPNFVKARVTPAPNSCINNLKQIEGAKEQWALEHRKTAGDPVQQAAVVSYLKGSAFPPCPAGGVYRLGKVGEPPRCTFPGHSL